MNNLTIETKIPEQQMKVLYELSFLVSKLTEPDEFLTLDEVAKFTKHSLTTIYRFRKNPLFASNPFPQEYRIGDDPRYLRSEIIEWMRRNGELAKEKS